MTKTGRDDRRLTRDPRLWRVVIAASLGVFAIELDFFAVQAALPDMARDLMTAAGTIGNMGTSTAIFTSMILLQSVDGLSASEAGVAFLGFSPGVAAASQISGRVERFPSWLVMSASLLCGGLGAIAMGLFDELAVFIVVATFAGLGFGMSWAFTSVSTQAVVPQEKAGRQSNASITPARSVRPARLWPDTS